MQMQSNTAHNLYELYVSLPTEVQYDFLQELLEKQHDKLENLAFYKACKEAKDEGEYLNLSEAEKFMSSLSQ
ncbi:MAG: hypothetical protein PSN04_02920 [Methyloprofundus sp.]|nr:hypothetical protein [Methyloprofundus sp.]